MVKNSDNLQHGVFTLLLNMLRSFHLETSKNIKLMKQIQLAIIQNISLWKAITGLNDQCDISVHLFQSVERSSHVIVVTLCGGVCGPDFSAVMVSLRDWSVLDWGGHPLRNVLVILEGRVIGNHVDLTETVREGVDHEKHQSRAVTDPLRDHLENRDNTSSGERRRGEPMAEGMSFVFGGSGPLHQGTSRCCLFWRAGGPSIVFRLSVSWPPLPRVLASVSEVIVELPFVLLQFSWRPERVFYRDLRRVLGPRWM